MATYSQTYSVQTSSGSTRYVTMIFADEKQSDEAEVDLYDSCRPRIEKWLQTHFNEELADNGDDIEPSGVEASHPEALDFRNVVPVPEAPPSAAPAVAAVVSTTT